MNRFLKKKAPEALHIPEETSNGATSPATPESPGLKKPATSRWRRAKKQAPEPAPAVEISIALPSNDDFRTSLLMPNLSARFSMLREQDDPKSLLGKASDDSVLQPRRRSRMAEFGHGRTNNLGDIAEVDVASISSSIRPPFAANGRQQSYASEDGDGSEADSTNTGSMMSRSRPGEGNILFGGRQKVYMIPNAGSSSSRSLGRQLYDDDMALSAFQRYRRRRHSPDGRPSDESQGFDFGLEDRSTVAASTPDAAADSESGVNETSAGNPPSPSLSSFEKKRSTTSTSRSEARSSFTAATSIGSHPNTAAPSPAPLSTNPLATSTPASAPPTTTAPLKRADTKTRRLYEQGLDQHMYEQQTSALTRLNSIQRQRHFNGRPIPMLHGTKSAGNLHDKASSSVYAVRTQSPVPVPPLASFGSIRNINPSNPSPDQSGPGSPTAGDFDADVFHQAIEPGDRGKATAMGAFTKPQQAFDEEQYLERQRQLQRSNSTAVVKKDSSTPSAVPNRLGSFDYERSRTDSDASARSGSRPPVPIVDPPTGSANAFAIAAKASQSSPLPANAPTSASRGGEKGAYPDTHRTFFGDISASESEDEEAEDRAYQTHAQQQQQQQQHHGRWQPTALPSVSEHPALRASKSIPRLSEAAEDEAAEVQMNPKRSNFALLQLPSDILPISTSTSSAFNGDFISDSPTVPNPAGPLNGLVKHLRQQSSQSSIFHNDDDAPEMPEWNPKSFDRHRRGLLALDSETKLRLSYAASNPWDLDEANAGSSSNTLTESTAQSNGLDYREPSLTNDSETSERSKSATSQIPALQQRPRRHSASSSHTSSNDHDNDGHQWQHNLRKYHTRDASTETQQERDAFADELAARRMAIQQNIKSMVERDNNANQNPQQQSSQSFSSRRQQSPGRNPSSAGGLKAKIRAKSSRENVADQSRPHTVVDGARPPVMPAKAMKTLGVNGNARSNTSHSSLTSAYSPEGRSPDVGRPRMGSGSRPQMPGFNGAVRVPSGPRDGPSRQDGPMNRGPSYEEGSERSPLPAPPVRSPTGMEGRRSRANSEAASSRSRSRTVSNRDEIDSSLPRPIPSLDLSPNKPRNLRREGSDNALILGDGERNPYSDRRSPALPSPNASAGPWSHSAPGTVHPSARSSPASTPVPYATNRTPPVSSSPVENASAATAAAAAAASFQSLPQIPGAGSRPLRKKTISKHDISEPILVSTTSNIDTVDLPEGASLKNGMESPPPPIPPFNPKRRGMKLFGRGAPGVGMGRADSDDGSASINSNFSSSRARSPEGFGPTSNPGSTSTLVGHSNSGTIKPVDTPLQPPYDAPFPPPAAPGMSASSRSRSRSTSTSPRPSTTTSFASPPLPSSSVSSFQQHSHHQQHPSHSQTYLPAQQTQPQITSGLPSPVVLNGFPSPRLGRMHSDSGFDGVATASSPEPKNGHGFAGIVGSAASGTAVGMGIGVGVGVEGAMF